MMIYFRDDPQEGRVMTSDAPSKSDVAALQTPPFDLPVNAYIWAMDEAVKRGLLEWQGDELHKAATYDSAKAFEPF